MRAAAEWAWRLLVIGAAVYALMWVVKSFEEVFVPIGLAILDTALLVPVVDWLSRRRIPGSLAVVGTLIAGIGAIAGILTFVLQQFIDGVPQLTDKVTSGALEWHRKDAPDVRGGVVDESPVPGTPDARAESATGRTAGSTADSS